MHIHVSRLRTALLGTIQLAGTFQGIVKIQLDDGTEGGRQVCAGIKAWYTPEDLIGREVVIVANLEPRKIRGELSEGMILAASEGDGDDRSVVVLTVDRPVPAGSSVS